MTKEKRQSERYQTEAEIYFHVNYDLETKVEYRIESHTGETPPQEKYHAVSRNISAEGLCFVSNKELDTGLVLYLEVYVPSKEKPVIMEGEVRWSLPAKDKDNLGKFDTGVRLLTVMGKPVQETIYEDVEYKIKWSAVLESVLGAYRVMAQEREKDKRKK